MAIDLEHFTPWRSLLGGALIGASATALVLFNGRIAGISGIVGGVFGPRSRAASVPGDRAWRLAFLVGLCVAAIVAPFVRSAFPSLVPSLAPIGAGAPVLVVAGLLVGVGTRLANGCTSGHGVCGLSRGSLRSLVATMTFIATGVATVFATRLLGR